MMKYFSIKSSNIVHKREGGNISQIPPADMVEKNSNQYKILETISNNEHKSIYPAIRIYKIDWTPS